MAVVMAAVMVVATEAVMVGGTAAEGGDGVDGVGMATLIGVGEDSRQDILSVLPCLPDISW